MCCIVLWIICLRMHQMPMLVLGPEGVPQHSVRQQQKQGHAQLRVLCCVCNAGGQLHHVLQHEVVQEQLVLDTPHALQARAWRCEDGGHLRLGASWNAA